MKKKVTVRSPEEKQDIVQKIQELTTQGKPLKAALTEVKVNPTQYYAWRKKKNRTKQVHEVLTFPQETGKLTIIHGPIQDVLQALERLVQIR
jgi:transposase-like protein